MIIEKDSNKKKMKKKNKKNKQKMLNVRWLKNLKFR